MLAGEDATEAAIFAILGGNLKLVAPLCKGWHDRLWASCRCWLEASLDGILNPLKHKKSVNYFWLTSLPKAESL